MLKFTFDFRLIFGLYWDSLKRPDEGCPDGDDNLFRAILIAKPKCSNLGYCKISADHEIFKIELFQNFGFFRISKKFSRFNVILDGDFETFPGNPKLNMTSQNGRKVKYGQYTNCLARTILKNLYGPHNSWFDFKL